MLIKAATTLLLLCQLQQLLLVVAFAELDSISNIPAILRMLHAAAFFTNYSNM